MRWELRMIFFRAEAIFASSISKFGKSLQQTDRGDFNSSNEQTISTSLIHNIVSDRKSEQVVAWFLNLIFQHKNDCGVRKNCNLDICCLCCPTMEFCGTSTVDNSWSTAFLQMSALELCCASVFNLHVLGNESLCL